jgi:hypothetical protein
MKEQPGLYTYALYTAQSNRPAAFFVSGGVEQYVAGPSALPVNAWSHLAATYDGSMLRLYVNGTEVASQSATGTIATSSQALRIGGTSVWKEYFVGQIDEVRIYNRPLTRTEIQADQSTALP